MLPDEKLAKNIEVIHRWFDMVIEDFHYLVYLTLSMYSKTDLCEPEDEKKAASFTLSPLRVIKIDTTDFTIHVHAMCTT
jgi:hypothetical protein